MNKHWAIKAPYGGLGNVLGRDADHAWRLHTDDWNGPLNDVDHPLHAQHRARLEAQGYRAVRLVDAEELREKVEGLERKDGAYVCGIYLVRSDVLALLEDKP